MVTQLYGAWMSMPTLDIQELILLSLNSFQLALIVVLYLSSSHAFKLTMLIKKGFV